MHSVCSSKRDGRDPQLLRACTNSNSATNFSPFTSFLKSHPSCEVNQTTSCCLRERMRHEHGARARRTVSASAFGAGNPPGARNILKKVTVVFLYPVRIKKSGKVLPSRARSPAQLDNHRRKFVNHRPPQRLHAFAWSRLFGILDFKGDNA